MVAAAVQTHDNARISFVSDAGACSDALTSDAAAAAAAAADSNSSNTQFCSQLVSWSTHSHGHMSAAITTTPQQITAGIPFQIDVNITGTPDALAAATAAGLYGGHPCYSAHCPSVLDLTLRPPAIVRIADDASIPPIPLALVTAPATACHICSIQMSAAHTVPAPPSPASSAPRTLTVTVRTSASKLGQLSLPPPFFAAVAAESNEFFAPRLLTAPVRPGHSHLNARVRTTVLPPKRQPPSVSFYLRLVQPPLRSLPFETFPEFSSVEFALQLCSHCPSSPPYNVFDPGAICCSCCRCVSPVTRQTSHVTRHTSHVTRHTSHVTRHSMPQPSLRWNGTLRG